MQKPLKIRGFCYLNWVQGLDLNQRPSGYEPDELPGCSTLQQGGGKGASRPKKCQRLSLLEADLDFRASDIRILEREGYGGLRELLDPDPDRLHLGLGVQYLHSEDVSLLVELRAHGELDRPIHGHDSAYPCHAYRALEEVFSDIG